MASFRHSMRCSEIGKASKRKSVGPSLEVDVLTFGVLSTEKRGGEGGNIGGGEEEAANEGCAFPSSPKMFAIGRFQPSSAVRVSL